MDERYGKLAGALLTLGAVQFVAVMLVSEAIYPNYSVSETFISDLGEGSTAPLFNGSVFLLGLLLVISSYLVFRILKKLAVPALLALSGLGAMGVGLFPMSAGALHDAASLAAFLFGGLTAVAGSTLFRRPINYISTALGTVSLLALALFLTDNYLTLGPGGMERLIVYPVLLWALIFGYLIGFAAQKFR